MSSSSADEDSKIVRAINRILQRSYLGKWAILGLMIGVVAGIGATIFYFLIQLTTSLVIGNIAGYYPPNPSGESFAIVLSIASSPHPRLLLIPISTAIGGLIAGLIVYKFAPEAEGHGTDEAIAAFHYRDGKIRRRVPVVKAIASAFTIGSGGSGGREGPTAQIAAGFGSLIGDLLHLSVRDRRIAVAVGIGAGIGSIFKSPFGGAVLSAEILYSGGDFEADVLLPGFIASPVGYVIFASFTGFTPIFGNSVNYTFTNPLNLVFYALLGIICGLVARTYSSAFYRVKGFFSSSTKTMVGSIPRFLRPMIGAATAGLIGIFFPEVLGMGYGFLQFLIDGTMSNIVTNYFTLPLFATLIFIVVLKIIATSLTVGSGGSAGVFAPSLVIGGFVGAAFWMVLDSTMPGRIPIPAPLVIVGMMAFFAGVGRVPIAVILMVSEMTGTLSLMAPSMVAAVLSYFVAGPKYTIYRSQVLKRSDSPAHRGEYSIPLLSKTFVSDAMNTNVIVLTPEDTVEKAARLMFERGFRGIPIVDIREKAGTVQRTAVGIVTMSDIMRVPIGQRASTKLSSIMTRNLIVAYPEDTLLSVLEKMTINGVGRLPVISKETSELVGIITRTDVIRAYEKAVKLLEEESITK